MRHEQAVNLTVAEALSATLSTPPFFDPLSVLRDNGIFEYTGADFTLSNPTQEIIAEAHATFGADKRIACILSLGCGQPGAFYAPEEPGLAEWGRFLERLAASGEQKAQSLESQMGALGLYHRFSVTNDLEGVSTLEVGDIARHTAVYLTDIAVLRKMDICIASLKMRDGISSLEQLSM